MFLINAMKVAKKENGLISIKLIFRYPFKSIKKHYWNNLRENKGINAPK